MAAIRYIFVLGNTRCWPQPIEQTNTEYPSWDELTPYFSNAGDDWYYHTILTLVCNRSIFTSKIILLRTGSGNWIHFQCVCVRRGRCVCVCVCVCVRVRARACACVWTWPNKEIPTAFNACTIALKTRSVPGKENFNCTIALRTRSQPDKEMPMAFNACTIAQMTRFGPIKKPTSFNVCTIVLRTRSGPIKKCQRPLMLILLL